MKVVNNIALKCLSLLCVVIQLLVLLLAWSISEECSTDEFLPEGDDATIILSISYSSPSQIACQKVIQVATLALWSTPHTMVFTPKYL